MERYLSGGDIISGLQTNEHRGGALRFHDAHKKNPKVLRSNSVSIKGVTRYVQISEKALFKLQPLGLVELWRG